MPALSPVRKPTEDFDELLYKLSAYPGAPLLSTPREGRETPVDSLTLSWRAPDDTGGLPLTHYLIEQRASDTRGLMTSWLPVMTVPADQTSTNIIPEVRRRDANSVSFRVRAVNSMGPGLPLETIAPISVRSHERAPAIETPVQIPPEAPQGPLRADIISDKTIDLSWRAPRRWPEFSPYRRREGAVTPVFPHKYIIEATLADDSTAPWLEVGTAPGTATSATVRLPPSTLFRPASATSTDLPRPLLYRVRAENEFGYSAPLTTRVIPDLEHARLPVLPDVPVRAKILEPLEAYQMGIPPSLELEWPSFVPSVSPAKTTDRAFPTDYNYFLEYRPAGDLGWRHLAILPLGQEHYTFYPPAPHLRDLEAPKTEAYQFRVGVRGPYGTGGFRDSNIVSWTYRDQPFTPRPIPQMQDIPTQSSTRPPLNFEYVRSRIDTERGAFALPQGLIELKWRSPVLPSTGPSPGSFILERWIPETSSWRTLSHKITDVGRGAYEATVPHLSIDEPHFLRVSAVGPLGASQPTSLPYPIWISGTAKPGDCV